MNLTIYKYLYISLGYNKMKYTNIILFVMLQLNEIIKTNKNLILNTFISFNVNKENTKLNYIIIHSMK